MKRSYLGFPAVFQEILSPKPPPLVWLKIRVLVSDVFARSNLGSQICSTKFRGHHLCIVALYLSSLKIGIKNTPIDRVHRGVI